MCGRTGTLPTLLRFPTICVYWWGFGIFKETSKFGLRINKTSDNFQKVGFFSQRLVITRNENYSRQQLENSMPANKTELFWEKIVLASIVKNCSRFWNVSSANSIAVGPFWWNIQKWLLKFQPLLTIKDRNADFFFLMLYDWKREVFSTTSRGTWDVHQ